MNWIEQKNKLFENLYLPFFTENGFKKRGWEFYKEIGKDRLGVVVKLNSSGNNLDDSVSFRISVGLKFNPKFPEKLKKSEITLYECEVQFSIAALLYPEETVTLGEYWYDLGKSYEIPLGPEIGSKYVSEHNYYGAFEGTGINTIERISEYHIKSAQQTFNKKGELTEQTEHVYRDMSNRYDTMNIDSIYKQLAEDIRQVIDFVKELNDFDAFVKKDTQKLIPEKLKKEIIEKYC